MAHHKACISACDVFLYTSGAIVFSMKLPIRKQTKSPHQKKHTKTAPQTRLRLNVHTCMWLGVPQPASNYCLYTSLLRLQDKMVCLWSNYICFFNITVLMRFSVAIGLKQTDKQKTHLLQCVFLFPSAHHYTARFFNAQDTKALLSLRINFRWSH